MLLAYMTTFNISSVKIHENIKASHIRIIDLDKAGEETSPSDVAL